MYNNLREKVNLLLEDDEFKLCPFCHEMIDNHKCETAQESFNRTKQERIDLTGYSNLKGESDSFGTDENYILIAKQILKRQKKLGKLKSVKVQVLSLDESRKKRLKSTGILVGSLIGTTALATAVDYTIAKKANDSINKINRDKVNGDVKSTGTSKRTNKSIKKKSFRPLGDAIAISTGLGGLSLALTKNYPELVIICDYEYGKKILPLFPLTENVDKNKAIRTIGSNVTKAVKKLQKAQEWAIKEDVSDIQFMTAQLKDLLVENVLNY